MLRPIPWPIVLGLAAPLHAQGGAAAAQPLPRATFITTMDGEYRKLDANKDGQVTRAEVVAYQRSALAGQILQRQRTAFAALDSDRNGQISPAEFTKLPVNSPAPNPDPIMAFDLNRDGRLTLIEHRTATLANFDRIDADKDGIASAAEMRAGGVAR